MSIDVRGSGDGVAIITINRPEKLNALDAAHYADLSAAWCSTRDDPSIRAIVITGAGSRSFSAGADLHTFIGNPADAGDFFKTQKGMLLNRGVEMWKPVIAAVNGFCLGGGMTLMLATDIRIAAESATFGLLEVKRGVIAANGGTQRTMDQLPRAIAMEVLLTGDRFDAKMAERWGLVNRVVGDDEVLTAACAIASRIARNAPLAVQAAKELAVRSRDMHLAEGLRMEQFANRMLSTTDDAKEGRLAFMEKREPVFLGN